MRDATTTLAAVGGSAWTGGMRPPDGTNPHDPFARLASTARAVALATIDHADGCRRATGTHRPRRADRATEAGALSAKE